MAFIPVGSLGWYSYCNAPATMTNYASFLPQSPKKTPQTQQARGDQVPNSGGGFTFEVDDWVRLDRFLTLGSEANYYSSAQTLTQDNAKALIRLLKEDGPRVVTRIATISEAGRAPKNDPAIFALALASVLGDLLTRQSAYHALPEICRIGTHLFQFVKERRQLTSGRMSAGFRRAIARWYQCKDEKALAYQLVKYQQREGFSHRDLLRLARPDMGDSASIRWAVDGLAGLTTEKQLKAFGTRQATRRSACDVKTLPRIIEGFERAKRATAASELVTLIQDFDLPRETVPTAGLRYVEVWEALLQKMPATAMLRNLAKMTEVGLFKSKKAVKLVTERLTNVELLKKARVHPISVLLAAKVYATGHGLKGKLSWTPHKDITQALDDSFYAAFGAVTPTGKRIMVALDISSSMATNSVAGVPNLSAREAAAAMAMLIVKTEPDFYTVAFSGGMPGAWRKPKKYPAVWPGYGHVVDGITALPLGPGLSLPQVVAKTSNLPMGGTDCALPMIYALDQKLPVDAFIIVTDNETWQGGQHPYQALQEYRQAMGIPAKLAVLATTATNFTIADPRDNGMIDIAAFDSAVPNLLHDFIGGVDYAASDEDDAG